MREFKIKVKQKSNQEYLKTRYCPGMHEHSYKLQRM